MEALVPLLVAGPLGMGFVVVVLAHVKGAKRFTGALGAAAVLANLAISFSLLGVDLKPMFVGGWGPDNAIGIQIVCDGLSQLMAVIINLVALAAFIFAGAYMRRFTRVWLFEALFLLMTAAMNGVVISGDLFNMYVFIEVAAIASYGLVAFGCESEELEAAFKYLVLGVVASTFILTAIAVLYSVTGQLNMARISAALAEGKLTTSPAVLLATACLLGGLALKSAMVPFHAWLPDAHPSAPAPISAMLSGVLIKAAGVYALARVVFNVLGPNEACAAILIVLGTTSMVIGVFLAVGQWDFKRLLAYHSISQMGYVVLALGAGAGVLARGGSEAVAGLCLFGGLFHMFNHAAFKSLLFLASGSIEQQTGTRHLKELGGLAKNMPFTSLCCRIGALSIAGVPPFNGFFSKLIIIVALAVAGYPVLAALAVLVALMTLISFIKVQRYALEGEPGTEATASAREAPVLMCVGLAILAVVCCVGGLAMVPLKDYLFGDAGKTLLQMTKALGMMGVPQ